MLAFAAMLGLREPEYEKLEGLYFMVNSPAMFAALSVAYRSAHAASLRDRRQWFEPSDGPSLALWWIPAGHTPTVAEAIDRLQLLKERGPSPDAFTFRKPFPPPHAEGDDVTELDAAFCEWTT